MNVTFATVDHRTIELDARVDYKLSEGINHSSTRVQGHGVDTYVLATHDQVSIALDLARSAHSDHAEVRHEVIKAAHEEKAVEKPVVEKKSEAVEPKVEKPAKVEKAEEEPADEKPKAKGRPAAKTKPE